MKKSILLTFIAVAAPLGLQAETVIVDFTAPAGGGANPDTGPGIAGPVLEGVDFGGGRTADVTLSTGGNNLNFIAVGVGVAGGGQGNRVGDTPEEVVTITFSNFQGGLSASDIVFEGLVASTFSTSGIFTFGPDDVLDVNGVGLVGDEDGDGVALDLIFGDIDDYVFQRADSSVALNDANSLVLDLVGEAGGGYRLQGLELTVPDSLDAGPILCIENDPSTPNTLAFSFESEAGFEYDLLSSVDLSTPVAEWPAFDDGVTVFENIAASGTGTNELNGVALVGETRFFALQVRALGAETLFETNFDTDNGGFTALNNSVGSDWEFGEPDSSVADGQIVIDVANSTPNCWGTTLGDFTVTPSETGGLINDTDASLRSPVLDLTGISQATLTFAENIDLDPNVVANTLEVWVIDDTTDDEIGNGPIYTAIDPDFNSTSWNTTPEIELPTEALGQAIRLEFRISVPDAFSSPLGWYIDDVLVEGL